MKYINSILILSSICCLSCSHEHNSEVLPSLPLSWHHPDQCSGCDLGEVETPTPETEKSVGATFSAFTGALTEKSSPMVSSSGGHPADWTPWHLDGVIANFGVDVGGVFGFLLLDGTATVTGTWQKKKPSPAAVTAKSVVTQSNALKISGALNENDISHLIEPAVQSAAATKSVTDVNNLRTNLTNRAVSFLTICRALEAIVPTPGWHLGAFQLQLTFDAQGQVTPTIGVGGVLNVFLDWSVTGPPVDRSKIPPDVLNSPIYKSLSALIYSMSSLVPDAKSEASILQGSGFTMDQFQIGIGLSVNGTVGLAQAGAEIQGKLMFNSDGDPSSTGPSLAVASEKSISLVASGSALEIKIPIDQFKKGLKKAINIGAYFAKEAKRTDTANWQIIQLFTEFDATLSGNVQLSTLGLQGQFLLVYDRM